jgi:hypothetical protein
MGASPMTQCGSRSKKVGNSILEVVWKWSGSGLKVVTRHARLRRERPKSGEASNTRQRLGTMGQAARVARADLWQSRLRQEHVAKGRKNGFL